MYVCMYIIEQFPGALAGISGSLRVSWRRQERDRDCTSMESFGTMGGAATLRASTGSGLGPVPRDLRSLETYPDWFG